MPRFKAVAAVGSIGSARIAQAVLYSRSHGRLFIADAGLARWWGHRDEMWLRAGVCGRYIEVALVLWCGVALELRIGSRLYKLRLF